MARMQIRYLITKPGAPGCLPRYFWQPSSALRAEGWAAQRVPLDWHTHTDPDALRAAAIARAQDLNTDLDQARAAQPAAPTAPPPVPAFRRPLNELIAAYKASPDFTRLAAKTQTGYRQCLDRLAEWGGDLAVRAIDAIAVQALLTAYEATPAFGNAIVRVLRLVLEWGRRHHVPATTTPWIVINPATRPNLAEIQPGGIIWPREAVAAFVALADEQGCHSIGTAVALNEWFGQREGDILRMPRSIIRNGTLIVRQSKTGATVTLPVAMVAALQSRLTAELARADARHAQAAQAAREKHRPPPPLPTSILVCETTGRAWNGDHFRHTFAELRAKLAERTPFFEIDYLLPGRDMEDPDAFRVATTGLIFMRMRHTAVTRGAEAGATPQQTSGITGHAQTTIEKILARYTVRTAALARGAFQKRLDADAAAETRGQEKQA